MIGRPLVLVVLFSAGLFGWYGFGAPSFDATVTITDGDAAAAVQFVEELLGQTLTEAGRDSAVTAYIEDEILVREAYRTGVDRGDPRVRTILVDATREVLQPDEPEAAPTEEQLRAYFEENRDRYGVPEARTFDQVFFPFGWLDDAGEVAMRDSLERGSDPESLVRDVEFANIQTVRNSTRRGTSRSFGRRFSEELYAIDDSEWRGPLRSPQGVHYVRILDRRASRERTFDEVRSYVVEDWHLWRRIERTRVALRDIRDRYDVRIGTEER